jgi:hypothetical protein
MMDQQKERCAFIQENAVIMFFPKHITNSTFYRVLAIAYNTQNYGISCTRGAPKVMPPTLLCWPMTLEMDAGGVEVEV